MTFSTALIAFVGIVSFATGEDHEEDSFASCMQEISSDEFQGYVQTVNENGIEYIPEMCEIAGLELFAFSGPTVCDNYTDYHQNQPMCLPESCTEDPTVATTVIASLFSDGDSSCNGSYEFNYHHEEDSFASCMQEISSDEFQGYVQTVNENGIEYIPEMCEIAGLELFAFSGPTVCDNYTDYHQNQPMCLPESCTEDPTVATTVIASLFSDGDSSCNGSYEFNYHPLCLLDLDTKYYDIETYNEMLRSMIEDIYWNGCLDPNIFGTPAAQRPENCQIDNGALREVCENVGMDFHLATVAESCNYGEYNYYDVPQCLPYSCTFDQEMLTEIYEKLYWDNEDDDYDYHYDDDFHPGDDYTHTPLDDQAPVDDAVDDGHWGDDYISVDDGHWEDDYITVDDGHWGDDYITVDDGHWGDDYITVDDGHWEDDYITVDDSNYPMCTLLNITFSGLGDDEHEKCVDYAYSFVFKNKKGHFRTETCEWVANNDRKNKLCKLPEVKEACPSTCSACCIDSTDDFLINKKPRNCEWVKLNPEKRCKRNAMKNCVSTCDPKCTAEQCFRLHIVSKTTYDIVIVSAKI